MRNTPFQDRYAITHLDPSYGQSTTAVSGYYVSVWYNNLHAIVTEGTVRGPRTKDHYVHDTSDTGNDSFGSPFEERQRAIVLYTDPDFQDKIYNVVKTYFELRSNFTSLGISRNAFSVRGWEAYVDMQDLISRANAGHPGHPAAGIPQISPSEFVMACPEFPIDVRR